MNLEMHFPYSNVQVINIAGALLFGFAIVIAISGRVFINSYDIGSYRTSVIEASLIQVSHIRYLIAAVLTVASTICFVGGQLLAAVQKEV